jgi:hypothetical protein
MASDAPSARFCTVDWEKIRLATIVQALITATTTSVTSDGAYRRSKTAMPAETTNVPMLMAKASVTIVVSENETLTTQGCEVGSDPSEDPIEAR